MATLRKKRKLAAFSRDAPEKWNNSQSQNTSGPGMAQAYISQVFKQIEGRITKKHYEDFSRTESRLLGALSQFDEFLLNSQVRTCSVAVPETYRKNASENREPTGHPSLGDPCPEAVFST